MKRKTVWGIPGIGFFLASSAAAATLADFKYMDHDAVYCGLSRIYSHGMTVYNRPLILDEPKKGYVQCMLYEDDRKLYDDAASRQTLLRRAKNGW